MPKKTKTKTKIPSAVKVKPVEVLDLPKGAKVALVHSLREFNLTVGVISKNLNIPQRSVRNYLTQEVEPEWEDFAENVKRAVGLQEEKLATMALAFIEKKMPEAKFPELVGWYKIIRELQGRGSPQAVVPPGGSSPSLSLHIHQNEKIIQVVRKAEEEIEAELRQQIAGTEPPKEQI